MNNLTKFTHLARGTKGGFQHTHVKKKTYLQPNLWINHTQSNHDFMLREAIFKPLKKVMGCPIAFILQFAHSHVEGSLDVEM
jgi:hypothetical protein